MRLRDQTEDSVLRRITGDIRNPSKRRAVHYIALGMGDDAALFRPKARHETILTCDWFLEGTHFLRDKHPPDSVGWKCLARAVSDVAAMGGVPRCFLLSLALPASHTGRWLDQFLGGLRRAARKFECPLAGGDTTRRNDILTNVTVAGEIRSGRAVLRSGARAGDLLYVSGRLGEAELGLQILRRNSGPASRNNPLTRKHLYPEPRLGLGRWLAEHRVATAMMDLSDGLSSDLPRLCAASGVGASVQEAKIPLIKASDAAHKIGVDPLRLALDGGDDYELLFTVPSSKTKVLPATFCGLSLTAIGKITRGAELLLVEKDGRERRLLPCGWDAFRKTR